jgi:hypothetical protein
MTLPPYACAKGYEALPSGKILKLLVAFQRPNTPLLNHFVGAQLAGAFYWQTLHPHPSLLTNPQLHTLDGTVCRATDNNVS